MRWGIFKALRWDILYIGCAPALLLALRGAGLNPSASMPCVFGWLLFSITPLRGKLRFSWLNAAGTFALLFACYYYVQLARSLHTEPGENKVPMMAALEQGIDLIQTDATARGKRDVQFTTSHIVDFQTSALRNVLIYERGARVHSGAYRLASGLILRADHEWVMSPAVAMNWNVEIPGKNDAEKCAYLVALARQRLDYLFLPDDDSIAWMEQNRAQNFINTKIRMIKTAILASGHWTPFGPPLVASDYERVVLYARQ